MVMPRIATDVTRRQHRRPVSWARCGGGGCLPGEKRDAMWGMAGSRRRYIQSTHYGLVKWIARPRIGNAYIIGGSPSTTVAIRKIYIVGACEATSEAGQWHEREGRDTANEGRIG